MRARTMNCRDCIHDGECNGQPYCGGAWYERREDEIETEKEAEDGE